MTLGALLLEGCNYDFWVTLGCLSGHTAMKQHALIRGLQLDFSLASAWAYLGKLYREEDERKLARQAFDCARSIDPSLALPWAGMSADYAKGLKSDEEFESCLRAVHILPLAEYQIGLSYLALLTGHLASSQVYAAIQQAVQRSPQYPESHNLNGLACEARFEYETAVTAYRIARCAIKNSCSKSMKSQFRDITINLARALVKSGCASDALRECENLNNEGMLDTKGMQIYAVALWQHGKNERALDVARTLAGTLSTAGEASISVIVSFISRLLYCISGIDPAITSLVKMPKEAFKSTKTRLIAHAIYALDQSTRLNSTVLDRNYFLLSDEEAVEVNYLMALTELVKHGSANHLAFGCGVTQLRKALHLYPNSNLIRNLLGHLLPSTKKCDETHIASRCCIIRGPFGPSKEGLKSGYEILGAATVSCYAVGSKDQKLCLPTCDYLCREAPGSIQELQKYLHQEPWNDAARYLLILNLFQKAREERFPSLTCIILKRLLSAALSKENSSSNCMFNHYKKFQLLLCASEISLQCNNLADAEDYAKDASLLSVPHTYLFFSNLLLSRIYAAKGDHVNLRQGYVRCLKLKTDYHIGWICLRILECQYALHTDSSSVELSFRECSSEWNNSWMALLNLVLGLAYLFKDDLYSAEDHLAQACRAMDADSCSLLCHGAVSLELARRFSSSQLLLLAERSLAKATTCANPLPIASLLLAQVEGSLGHREMWQKHLRLEWYSWPPGMRPAELFFQMHLLAREPRAALTNHSSGVESWQSPEQWVLRAIHTNPSCLRYWRVLKELIA
ncbi:Tetratricopeptide repeat protein SKI3 [Linum perenne]